MINKDIIALVQKNFTRAGKTSARKIIEYISINEPEFNEYLKNSTFNDIEKLVEKFGIPPNKEFIKGLTSLITGAKIEGFLIHSIAQDKFWSGKYGLDINGELKPEDKFRLFLEGKLDPSAYNYELTKEELKDSDNYKKIALENFKRNQKKIKIENDLVKTSKNNVKDDNVHNKNNTIISGDLLE